MSKTTVGFSLDTDRDADIIAWLDRQENKSRAIREAIRTSWLRGNTTLGDVLNEIGEVKRMLRSGTIRVENSVETGKEQARPEHKEVQAALDSLGL